MKPSSFSRIHFLVAGVLMLATLACNFLSIGLPGQAPKPATQLNKLYTSPSPIAAIATDQNENVYAVTEDGKVIKISPNGKSVELYTGLKGCSFSYSVITVLPDGNVLVNDCVETNDTLISIDPQGNTRTILTITSGGNILSLASNASGQVFVGYWNSQGDISIRFDPRYLERADDLSGVVAVLEGDGTLKTIYEGGMPLGLVAVKDKLYASIWGASGPFHPESKEYSICDYKARFWMGMSDQVVIKQILPVQQEYSNLINAATYIAAFGDSTLFSNGLVEGDRCSLYKIGSTQPPQKLAFDNSDFQGIDITWITVSTHYLYIASLDADGKGIIFQVKLS